MDRNNIENEILVVSFGTTYTESIDKSIGMIEKKYDDYFHDDYTIGRAFTSPTIMRIIKKRYGIEIDNVSEALERAIRNNVKKIVVQPTHIMNGFDYEQIIETVHKYEQMFDNVFMGAPLLDSDDDFVKLSRVIVGASKEYDNNNTAICFVGHGTKAASNEVYGRLQNVLNNLGFENYYIGTVEVSPTAEDIFDRIKNYRYERIILWPLMLVAGDHANNDIAGDGSDSWKSYFENKGYEVVCVRKGLGELPEVANMFIEHTIKAINDEN